MKFKLFILVFTVSTLILLQSLSNLGASGLRVLNPIVHKPKSEPECYEDYKCRDSVCVPKDYDKAKAPSTNVLANIVLVDKRTSRDYNAIESIDVQTMKIRYNPKLVLVWKDPSVMFCNTFKQRQLNSNLISRILRRSHVWSPTIGITNIDTIQENRKSLNLSSYHKFDISIIKTIFSASFSRISSVIFSGLGFFSFFFGFLQSHG